MPETPKPRAGDDAPDISMLFPVVARWVRPLVVAGGLLIAGTTAWITTTARVRDVEQRVAIMEAEGSRPARVLATRVTSLESRADAAGLLSKRLTRIERLLAGVICTQSPQDPGRCREAMASVGEE